MTDLRSTIYATLILCALQSRFVKEWRVSAYNSKGVDKAYFEAVNNMRSRADQSHVCSRIVVRAEHSAFAITGTPLVLFAASRALLTQVVMLSQTSRGSSAAPLESNYVVFPCSFFSAERIAVHVST